MRKYRPSQNDHDDNQPRDPRGGFDHGVDATVVSQMSRDTNTHADRLWLSEFTGESVVEGEGDM